MASELVTIDRFLFVADAEVACATLTAAGIAAVVAGETTGDVQSHGGVRLRVRAEDADLAREILSTPFEAEFEPAEPLDDDEHCQRCFSTEIFSLESRGRTYARILLLTWLAFMLLNIASCTLHMTQRLLGGGYAAALIGAALAIVYTAVAPRKRCRNCGLTWRGTPRTN